MKWSGKIGFVETKETRPGVWENVTTERNFYGDVIRDIRKNQSSGQVNDDINISNRISIVSNSFVRDNLAFMKYIEFMGTKWKITDVEVQYPRLVLTIGGLWNE